MKIAALLFIASSLILPGSLCAQERRARASNFEADTKWPGILFSISGLERIQDNRLLVSVRVVATAKAARSGTFLGTMSGQRDSSGSPSYLRPFSLDSAVMTDDQTQQKYPALPPVAPPGMAYFRANSSIICFLDKVRRLPCNLPRLRGSLARERAGHLSRRLPFYYRAPADRSQMCPCLPPK